MQEINYTIKDEIGIHARPAGNLVKIAKEAESEVEMECKGKKADVKKIFSILSLSVKCGDSIKITVSGNDEEETANKIKEYLSQNL